MSDQVSPTHELLKDILELKIERLYVSDLPQDEQQADIRLTKQKIRLVKRDLRDKQKEGKQRWDARKGQVEKIMQDLYLAPLDLIDNLIAEIEVSLSELEIAIEFGRPLPKPPIIGEVAYPYDNPQELISYEETKKRCKKNNDEFMNNAQQQAKSIRNQINSLTKELENTKGLFSRGKREALEAQIIELKKEYEDTKAAYITGKFMSELQIALDEPICKDYFAADGYHKVIVSQEAARKELVRCKDSLKRLYGLRQLLSREPSLTKDFVPLTENFISIYMAVIDKLEGLEEDLS